MRKEKPIRGLVQRLKGKGSHVSECVSVTVSLELRLWKCERLISMLDSTIGTHGDRLPPLEAAVGKICAQPAHEA